MACVLATRAVVIPIFGTRSATMASMPPYRSAEAAGLGPSVTFGNRRRTQIVTAVGFALVIASIALVVAWLVSGGGIRGSVLLPAIAGGSLLLTRTSWGSLRMSSERRDLLVTVSRFGALTRTRVTLEEILGLNIEPVKMSSDHVLQLTLTGGRCVRLMRAASPAALESWRMVVGAFLLDQGLGGSRERLRVSVDVPQVVAPASAEEPNDLDSEPSRGRRASLRRHE